MTLATGFTSRPELADMINDLAVEDGGVLAARVKALEDADFAAAIAALVLRVEELEALNV